MAKHQPDNTIRIHFDFDRESLPSIPERKALQARLCEAIEEIYKLFKVENLEIEQVIDRKTGYDMLLRAPDIEAKKAHEISRIIEAAVRMIIEKGEQSAD